MANESQQNINTGSDEISLKELILKIQEWWRYLLSKWLFILIFGLLGGALGFAISYFRKPMYTATTTFVLEDDKAGKSMGSLAGIASIAGIDLGEGGTGMFQGDNIMELYKSRAMLKNALLAKVNFDGKSQFLIKRFIESNNFRSKLSDKAEKVDFSATTDLIVTRLQDSIISLAVIEINKEVLLVSKPDKKLSIINVVVKSKDEDFAKVFNDVVVATVSDFYVKTKTRKSLQNLAILAHQTDSVRAVVSGAILIGATTMDNTPNLNPTRQTLRVPIQKSQFNAEANKLILSELIKNLELSKINIRKETPLIQVIDAPVYPLEVDKNMPVLYSIISFLVGLILASLAFLNLTRK